MSALLMTVFLFSERPSLVLHWRLPVSVSGLLMLLTAFCAYFWKSLWQTYAVVEYTNYYPEMILSLPLQLMLLYLVLRVGGKTDKCLLKKIFALPLLVILFGWFSQCEWATDLNLSILGSLFFIGLMWLVWMGTGAKLAGSIVNLSARKAYFCLRSTLTVGWAAYLLIGILYALKMIDMPIMNLLSIGVNIVFRFMLVLIVWHAAYVDSGLSRVE